MKTLHKGLPEQKNTNDCVGTFLCTHCMSIIQYSNLDLWFTGSEPSRLVDCPECDYSTYVLLLGRTDPHYVTRTAFKIPHRRTHRNRKLAKHRVGKIGME